jgi:heme exporter protein C
MDPTMLAGMLVMTFAFWSYAIAIVLARLRAIVLERERGASWLAPPVARRVAEAAR